MNVSDFFYITLVYIIFIMRSSVIRQLKKNKPEFRLSQRRAEGLQKALNLMRSSHMISSKEKKSYKGVISGKIYSFEVWNKKIYHDLLNLGLTPAKTRDMKFPQLPSKYMNHFIWGLHDGDGALYRNRFDGNFHHHPPSKEFQYLFS
jgi:hypothetical protein